MLDVVLSVETDASGRWEGQIYFFKIYFNSVRCSWQPLVGPTQQLKTIV